MRASSPLVVLLMVALAALAKASVFGGRKRRGTPGGSGMLASARVIEMAEAD